MPASTALYWVWLHFVLERAVTIEVLRFVVLKPYRCEGGWSCCAAAQRSSCAVTHTGMLLGSRTLARVLKNSWAKVIKMFKVRMALRRILQMELREMDA